MSASSSSTAMSSSSRLVRQPTRPSPACARTSSDAPPATRSTPACSRSRWPSAERRSRKKSASALVAGARRTSPGGGGSAYDHRQWLSSPARAAPWATTTLTLADLQPLAALMRASGWRLLLGLDLGHPLPQSFVDEARAATSTFGSSLAGLEVGNEPDLYTRRPARPFRSVLGEQPLRLPGWGLSDYELEVARVRALLAQAGVSAALWGPDTATSEWVSGYATAPTPGLAALTPHIYPLDRCQGGRLTGRPSL